MNVSPSTLAMGWAVERLMERLTGPVSGERRNSVGAGEWSRQCHSGTAHPPAHAFVQAGVRFASSRCDRYDVLLRKLAESGRRYGMSQGDYREGILAVQKGAVFFQDEAQEGSVYRLQLKSGDCVYLELEGSWRPVRLDVGGALVSPTFFYQGTDHPLDEGPERRARLASVRYREDLPSLAFDDLKACVRRAHLEGWPYAFLTADFYDELVALGACCTQATLPEEHLRIESIVSPPLLPGAELSPELLQGMTMRFLTSIRDGLSGLFESIYLSRERLKESRQA
jgi:hypothetical protein